MSKNKSFFIDVDFGCDHLIGSQSKVWHNTTKKNGTDGLIDGMDSTFWRN
jgi:hypothetical protein